MTDAQESLLSSRGDPPAEGISIMTHVWPLQEVQDRFGDVIDAALSEGPQLITRSGAETAVVLSYAEYRKLLLSQKRLSDFFRDSPLAGVDLDLTRDHRERVDVTNVSWRDWTR
jgi:antitoxin Phd